MWEFFRWHGYEKNLVAVYGHVKNFGCGKIWWGIDFFFFFFLGLCLFVRMGIFWTWDFGHGIFFFFFLLREIFDHVVLVMENFLDM